MLEVTLTALSGAWLAREVLFEWEPRVLWQMWLEAGTRVWLLRETMGLLTALVWTPQKSLEQVRGATCTVTHVRSSLMRQGGNVRGSYTSSKVCILIQALWCTWDPSR